jgi:predicted dehydrogenase
MARERVVIVGAGGIMGAWMPPLIEEKVQIVGVVDKFIDAAQKRVDEYSLQCEASDDLAKTLRETQPDFVLNLTIPEAHYEVTCAALKAGAHVVSEKPMSATLQEARKMVKLAEETGKMFMVSQSRRWDANHDLTKRVLDSKQLGAITTLNCDFYIGAHFGGFRDEMDSPLILDMAVHHFDLARYFSGADAVAVYAHEFNPQGSWYKGDVAASCIFEMSNGSVFTYRGSWCSEGLHTSWNGDWRFNGEKGSVVMEKDAPPHGQVVAKKTSDFTQPLKDAKIPAPRKIHSGMHGALREMLAFLRKGTVPQTECHDNIKSLAMVLAAIESSKKRKRIEIKV